MAAEFNDRDLELSSGWSVQGWIPVAGDNCGNYYVLRADGSVGFVDTMSDRDTLVGTKHADLFAFVDAILIDDQAEH